MTQAEPIRVNSKINIQENGAAGGVGTWPCTEGLGQLCSNKGGARLTEDYAEAVGAGDGQRMDGWARSRSPCPTSQFLGPRPS